MKTTHAQDCARIKACTVGAALATVLAIPLSALADGDADVTALTKPTNTIELGVEAVTRSSAKFGEYNGLDSSGGKVIGNFNIRGGDAYEAQAGGKGTLRWEINGSDLGTSSRELGGTVGNQGTWAIGLNYGELRHNISDSYQTPYQGTMGGNRFTLPNTFGGIDMGGAGTWALDPATQLSAFHATKVHTDRKNTGFNAEYNFNERWSVQLDYNRLDQTGAKLIGVSNAPDPITGNGAGETIAILMAPTNYQVDNFNVSVAWIGDRAHFKLNYFGSIVDDRYSKVSWDNPFFDSTPSPGPAQSLVLPYPVNVFSTPPSNQLNQLNFSGGYELSAATRLAGGLSYGRNTQNSAYIDDPLAPLAAQPRTSLDAQVITTHADLKLTHQATRDLSLSAGFKYDERDNRTASSTYSAFTSVAGDPFGSVINSPVSNRKTQFDIGAGYRIDKAQSVRLGLESQAVKRWCDNALANNARSSDPGAPAGYYTTPACVQVGENHEDRLSAGYKLRASRVVTVNAGYAYAKRRAAINNSYYNPMQTSAEGFQNFGFVGYFDSARNEQVAKAGVNWQAAEAVMIGLNGRFVDDRYNAALGVQKARAWTANLDVTYAYSATGTASAYLTAQRRQRDLQSAAEKQPLAPVDPTTLWSNHLDDNTNTLGLNVKQSGLMAAKLDLAADLAYSLGRSTYTTNAQTCTNFNAPDVLCGDPATNGGELPTIRNTTLRLKLAGTYQVAKNGKVALSYLYRKLDSSDYYFSGYQYQATDISVLPTNQQAPSFSVSVIGVSYLYTFQ